ncbi:MAG: transketolase [Fimbriimonadaceae bacterium]|jgi:transketolase|nr:transketolase [Fimbriimonadaceae bacterium]
MAPTPSALDQTLVSALRFLSVDMVEQANSGHPGLPLGAAPVAASLWQRQLRFNPLNPNWLNRDRFVLSAGHGSALLYSLIHVFGYDLPLAELKNFRQFGSKTPGHPEYRLTPGVECTTGPLGQGMANAVGMAMAEQWLAANYNRPNFPVIDHFTYAIVSDGDLMEGVALEASSLAGHLKLGKLICLYDANDISLDGPCDLSFSEDVAKKFEATGWHVSQVKDGNDMDAVEQAILSAQKVTDRPSLIVVRTIIGFGSPKAGTSDAHGSPLGPDATRITKQALGWPVEPTFALPPEIEKIRNQAKEKGAQLENEWHQLWLRYQAEFPDLANQLGHISAGTLPEGWDAALDEATYPEGGAATRDAGKTALNAVAKGLPWLIGGAADLSGSTKTIFSGSGNYSATERDGRNLYYGVREHAMGAIVNGLCLHGLRGLGSTFLVFSDYMRGAIRLASLSHLPSLFVFTHDSVFVGEDGPTHEPIEQVMALRTVPGLHVYRPADPIETGEAYRHIVASGKASCLILTRQKLPTLSSYRDTIKAGAGRGFYHLAGPSQADVLLIASGSEVSLALSVAEALKEKGKTAKVVSALCWETFDAQDADYRFEVLGGTAIKVSLEAGVTLGWHKYVGSEGITIGIDRFGESAPGEVVYRELGMTVERVVSDILARF